MTGTTEDTRHIRNIVVFCGARTGDNPRFRDQAQTLGRLLAQNGYNLIYGGGDMGLMGIVSKAALDNGAKVKGIVPKIFHKASGAAPQGSIDGVAEDVVENMLIRKDRMILEADAAIAIPGGFGTLDEIYEVIVAQEMKIFGAPERPVQPMIVVNINGFFNGLKMQLQTSIDEGFIRPGRAALLQFVDSVEEAVALLNRRNQAAPEIAGTYARKPGLAP